MSANHAYHRRGSLRRRDFLKLAAGTGAAATLPGCASLLDLDSGLTAAAAILRAGYDNTLVEVIEDGFDLVPPPDVNGKRVLLKPNLVDLPRENKPVVTEPSLILAAAEAFRRRGAAKVIVGDGSALQRDVWDIVDAVGLTSLLAQDGIPFVDLGTDDVAGLPNLGGLTGFDTLYFSRTAARADVIVSVPKMKTHHWAGVSLAMKNMFGAVSGMVYGWPRNTFHLRNLNTGVMDFNLTLPVDYAIIDGIIGMEGDGPVRGTPVDSGVIIMGANPTAVDATATRVMRLRPPAIDYLRRAAGVLGPISEHNIEQRGESISSVRRRFRVLDYQAALVV